MNTGYSKKECFLSIIFIIVVLTCIIVIFNHYDTGWNKYWGLEDLTLWKAMRQIVTAFGIIVFVSFWVVFIGLWWFKRRKKRQRWPKITASKLTFK